ncbi:sigma 54-interacting transcriptional regulator [Heyndrickxia sporothermodurans]
MELKNQAMIYETIIDLIDVGIHVIDENGKTILYNKKMMEIEGTEIEDVLDKNILDVFHFSQGEDSTLLQVLHTGNPIFNIQQLYFNNKGQEIKTVNNTYPLLDQGKIVGAVEIVRDVTKFERMLKQSSDRMNQPSNTFEYFFNGAFFPYKVMETGKQMASNCSTILIIGESGTGKHILTECIHHEVFHSKRPYILLNCSSLPEKYVDEAIFEATNKLANSEGGTLVIEEIHHLPPSSQKSFLTALTRERKYKIICTMGEDPIDLIANGQLNKKLYYHLSELTIFIPPLRERKKMIHSIINHFLNKYNDIYQMKVKDVTTDVIQSFNEYDWPGNLREMEHIIESSMKVLDNEETLQLHHLPTNFRHRLFQEHQFLIQKDSIMPFDEYIQEAEKYYIQKALQYHQYNITKTAQALNMSRQNLQYRIRKYGIEKP